MLCSSLPPRIYESLKTLCCLAKAARPLQAPEIASAADLPPAQTAKILQFMTWAGFIDSRRGSKGGFWLVVPPDRIRVTEVADFFTHRNKEKPHRRNDPLLQVLAAAWARCHREFANITVSDLAKSQCARRNSSRTTMAPSRRPPQRKRSRGASI